MGFLQLCSTNPNFSYILKKNPDSGMLVKSCRKGRLFAWYTDPNTFNIYFRDSDMEVSYGKDDFEYMDVTRYNSPMFLINAFHEYLHHMKNKDEKDIVGYENTLIINQIKSKPYNIKEFKSHFQDYDFSFEEVAFHNYRIIIKTKNMIRELINIGYLIAIFNALTNNDLGYVSEKDIDKYLFCLKVVDAPYYIRHLFAIYFLGTKRLFKKYKPLLEKSEKVKLELEFGNSLIQRMNAIYKCLDFKSDIIDIGCGEGNYVREFAPILDKKNLSYHAIDINQESIERIKKFCTKEEIGNVKVWSSVEELISSGKIPNHSDILMTEVVEHMSKDDSALLIHKVLGWPFKSIIITTPNKEFNSNYCILEEEHRIEDHIFEMTKKEFRGWIEDIAGNSGASIKFFEIGDKVNNVQPTLAVAITEKEN